MSLHAVQQLLGGLGVLEEVAVLRAPLFVLYALPALRKVLLEQGEGVAQRGAAEHVRVQVASTVRVGAEDAPAEGALEVFERFQVAAVQLDLEGGPTSIA